MNEVNLALAKTILVQHSVSEIRKKSLTTLNRWRTKTIWCSAHEEWLKLIFNGSDRELVTAMTGKDEQYVRLRQFAPYTGLLAEETRQKIWNEVVSMNMYESLEI